MASTTARNWQRGFWSLIVTQFQGAFSDNALKWLIQFWVLSMALPADRRNTLVAIVGALFAVPFILFSMFGGFLADRFSKRSVMIGVKIFEIPVMLTALAGLAMGHLYLAITAMFLMSVHSAIFGPSKYGVLPELLPEDRLSWGNGIIELGTFVAIILGTVAGGVLFDKFSGHQAYSGMILVALAGFGLLISTLVTRVPAADPAKPFRINFLGDLWDRLRVVQRDEVLKLAVAGNTYFWFLGALLQSNIPIYSQDVLKIGAQQISYLNATLALAIGLGSVSAGYLSGGKIEYGLVPLGSLGITVLGIMLAIPGLSYIQVVALLAGVGFFSGFFIVPVMALIQHRPDENEKGGVIAASNLLSFVGIGAASGVFYLLTVTLHFPAPYIFLTAAAMTIAVTVYLLFLLPDALLRFLLWILTHTVYRIRIEGRQNIPSRGGALFVCNHLSLVDGLLLIASTERRVRFLVFKDIYDHPLVKPWAKILKCIPISSTLRPRDMIHSLRSATEAIEQGRVVCIFAEGQITRIGQLLPFRRGFERIMKGVDAPIIPVNLDGVWGSIFSYEKGRFVWKKPKRIPYPVTVSFGQPMPSTATAFEVRQAVQELHSTAYLYRKARMTTLHRAFVHTARRRPWRFFAADFKTEHVTFGRALIGAVLLARRLRTVWKDQEMVGVLLPPSVAGALVNFAAMLMGKTPVNLNYTASNEILASCGKQCGLRTVISSRAFLERVPLQPPGDVVLMEDLAANPGGGERLAAAVMAFLLPVSWLEKALGRGRPVTLDDTATVIFSSGSTGDPKGVMLTHYNIGSNIEQLGQTFFLGHRDRVMGVLPFFHSFGFTGTLCLPGVLGVGVVYHPSPLDARVIGGLVAKYACTVMLATPTFIQGYTRRCSAEDFGSLQYVLVGAEKLSDRVANAFEETFGLRPLEAYGCTECSPAVTVNTRDFRAPGFRQVGAKRGRIGHPLPGVSVRIVDPEAADPLAAPPLPPGQSGLLLVRGPNIMRGYLGRPEKTAEVLRDGWYITGDIAAVDDDGFLAITDRLSRFSKIGGEMVAHIKVEDKLHELAGITEQTFVVTGVPDSRKGERLVVLHTMADDRLTEVLEKLAASDLPNLWKPARGQFFHVELLPYLGSGKLDLRALREAAGRLSGEA
jgi:acyl-[acyl-carrier-protein]-phospholipid O-acyltransferase / long-chain-fatty-acid--[acyl-carrier-protein] ligase